MAVRVRCDSGDLGDRRKETRRNRRECEDNDLSERSACSPRAASDGPGGDRLQRQSRVSTQCRGHPFFSGRRMATLEFTARFEMENYREEFGGSTRSGRKRSADRTDRRRGRRGGGAGRVTSCGGSHSFGKRYQGENPGSLGRWNGGGVH